MSSVCHMYNFCFKPQKATVSRYVITWTNFLYFSFDPIPIRPTREQINGKIHAH